MESLYRRVISIQRQRAAAPSAPADTDPLVMRAHRLLTKLEPESAPPLDAIHVGWCPGAAACYRGLIVINPESDYYRTGDLLVATLIFHEYFHALHGSDEASARAASDTFYERHRR